MEIFLLSKTIIKNTKWEIKYKYKQLVNIKYNSYRKQRRIISKYR